MARIERMERIRLINKQIGKSAVQMLIVKNQLWVDAGKSLGWKKFLYLRENVFFISSWTFWLFQSIVNIFLFLSSAATRIRQTEFFQSSAYEFDWKHKKTELWSKKSAAEIRNIENEKWWKSFQLHFFS